MDHQRTSRARPTPARAATALASALLATLLLSACGGSSKPTATTSATAAAATAPSTSSTTPAKPQPGTTHAAPPESRAFTHALSKFAICLRAHGIKLPEPRTSGKDKGPVFDTKGVNTKSAQFRSAETACSGALRASLPATAGTRPTEQPETQADLDQKYSKFIACVGKYGVHLSPPSSDGGPIFSGPETRSPKFRTAEVKCESTISLSSPAKATPTQPGSSAATEQKAAEERVRAQVKRAKIPAAVEQGFHKFSVCMRENGVSNYPEPEGMSFDTSKLDIDENTPQFKAASKKCEPILNAAVDPQSTQPPSGG
jgi:hypothetical protein